MKKTNKYLLMFCMTAALFTALLTAGCSLDVSNPNSPTEEDLNTYDGVKLLSIGLQSRLSQSIGDYITVSGAVSGESSPIIGYLDYQSLRRYPDNSRRTMLDKTNSYVRLVWAGQYRIMKTADDILQNVNNIAMDDATKRGIVALAEVGKSIAMYTLITHWEKIPVTTTVDYPEFADRNAVIAEALRLLNDAQSKLAAGPLSTEFTTKILGTGLDLANTVQAMKARFYLMKGDYTNAAAVATAVTAESEYVYALSVGYNPLYEHFFQMKFTGALESWVKEAEAGDLRIPATIDPTTRRGYFGSDTAYIINKYNAQNKSFKIYTLNEMALIKAEAYVRGGGGDAAAEINRVRASAGLPPYSGNELLKEIFRQRYYELYMTGQHWEDLRRFRNDNIDVVNQQRATQLSHEWLTYPDTEIDKNFNTPSQPVNINYGM